MRYLVLFVGCLIISCNQADKKPSGYVRIDNDKTACLLSQLAYNNEPGTILHEYLPGWQLVWEAAELGGNHAIVLTDGTSYALAIRGSLIEFSWAAFQNWIYQDLNIASLESWPYADNGTSARVSAGSFEGWQHLQQMKDKKSGIALLEFLEDNIKEDTPLLITGHSLGGNLATLYASYLWQTFKNKNQLRKHINVITLAAPAAGNAAFADDFNAKFPSSVRIENSNDIVPKFPCSAAVNGLSKLYTSAPAAGEIMVGYKNMTVTLSRVFSLLSTALTLLEFRNGTSYSQTNGEGHPITIRLSGKNASNAIGSWLSEAGYQHAVSSYASQLGVPVISTNKVTVP